MTILHTSNRVQTDSSATQRDNLSCKKLQIRILGTCELHVLEVTPHVYVPEGESRKAVRIMVL